MRIRIFDKLKNSSFFKNSIISVWGEGVASLLQLLSLSLMTLSLGSANSGVLLMLLSYSEIFYTIFSFQSYNAIVSFVGKTILTKDVLKTKVYIKQALVQDLIASIVGIVFAYFFMSPISKIMNWDAYIISLLKLYVLFMLFNNKGVFIGILRLFNRFTDVAIASCVANLVKFIWFFIGLVAKKDILFFLCGEIFLILTQTILLFIFSYIELKRQNLLDFIKCKLVFDKEFVKFNVYNNLVSSADLPINQLTAFIVNKFLGFEEVTLFKVIQKFAGVLQKVMLPIREVLFPQLSKLTSEKNIKTILRINKRYIGATVILGFTIILFILFSGNLWLPYFMTYSTGNVFSLLFYICFIILTNSLSLIHLLFMTFNLVQYNLPIIFVSNILYMVGLYLLKDMMSINLLITLMFIQALTVISVKYYIFNKKIINKSSL